MLHGPNQRLRRTLRQRLRRLGLSGWLWVVAAVVAAIVMVLRFA
jgi:hypothetical protein